MYITFIKYIILTWTFYLPFLVNGQIGLQVDRNSFLGSGATGAHILLFETEDDFARLRFTNSLINPESNNRFWDIAARIGTSNELDLLNFYSRQYGDILSLRGDGKVGVLTSTPSATLEVNGYTMLGNDAPKIKMKKIEVRTDYGQTDECFDTGISREDLILDSEVQHFDADGGVAFKPNFQNENFRYYIAYDQNLGVNNEISVCITKPSTYLENEILIIFLVYEDR